MKRLFLVAAMAAVVLTMSAQQTVGTFSIQPRLGLNLSGFSGKDADGSSYKVGFTAGVEGEYQFNRILALSVGAMYSQEGCSVDERDGAKMKIDYLNIPVLLNAYVAKGLAVKVGVQPGFKLSSNISAEGITVDFNAMKTMDISIPVGLSYEYRNLVLDARYNWGLANIVDGDKLRDYYKMITVNGGTIDTQDMPANPSMKNTFFTFTVGYRFQL